MSALTARQSDSTTSCGGEAPIFNFLLSEDSQASLVEPSFFLKFSNRWAREGMFMARDALAGAAGASEARIDAFETDNAMPMFRQLRLIGKTR